MGGTEPGSAREEAERLVATVLAAARLAGAGSGSGAGPWGPVGGILSSVLGHSGGGRAAGGPAGAGRGGFATGAAECCICPVCRGIAALRDPSPEFAERLATGAGDLAAGVASLLRAFASAGDPAHRPPEPEESSPAPPRTGADQGSGDHVWREATRTGHDSQPAPEQDDVWSAATRGEGPGVPAAVVPPVDDAGPDAPGAPRPPAGRPVVPASRTPGSAGEDAPGDGA
ncbi:hypothetical protein C5N14_16130 [Micromonospora sp. MW-13]|uniref:hypothetical protein n=1 Tax=unclassified Micromonospora TaxID=2617518 RepID=UPI000E44EFFB|nr:MULTISPECIES: hypothetical protein [unclassified Micromonospora]MCX4470941.1 hypothetical protein [Micromonospora sp. NBC_01655]RGC68013.1 hypothetical protein C5N14_16130 [Micromonospora sp. MW-13]